jgi:hypothetical protein
MHRQRARCRVDAISADVIRIGFQFRPRLLVAT